MPVSDLLSSGYYGNRAGYIPTSFADVTRDRFDQVLRDDPQSRFSADYYIREFEEGRALEERNKLLNDRLGRDVVAEVRDQVQKENPQKPGSDIREHQRFIIDTYQARLDDMIDAGRQEDLQAWAGIRKAAEIRDATIDRAQVAQIEADRTSARAESDVANVGGNLLGGMGALLDPINLVTLPLGAGAGASVIRAAVIDGALNMGVEAVQTPSRAEWINSIGFKYGFGDAAADIAIAGVGGAGLSALIRGAGKGLNALKGQSEAILRDVAGDMRNSAQVREAAQYMERVAHIDENIPPLARIDDGVHPMEVVASHRHHLKETQDAFGEYRNPVYSEDIPFDVAELTVRADIPPARSFEEGAATRGKYSDYTTPTPQELRYMQGAIRELQQSEKGKLLFREQQGQGATPDVIKAQENTFPEWFRQLNREGESLSRDYVAKVFDKVQSSKPLGKKEVRVAKALFSEAQGQREVNARQILNFRQDRAVARNDAVAAEIDAVYQRELAREMADPYLQNPQQAARSLAEDIKAGAEDEMIDAARADFERELAENPDMEMLMEDGSTKTLADIAEELADDGEILRAVTICGVG